MVSGDAALLPVASIASRISCALACGCACMISAADDETSGVACDVPDTATGPTNGLYDHTPTPGAEISGLMRPSAVGPREEKSTIVSLKKYAPTARMLSASAGALMYGKGLLPSLPAAVTMSI